MKPLTYTLDSKDTLFDMDNYRLAQALKVISQELSDLELIAARFGINTDPAINTNIKDLKELRKWVKGLL